MTNASRVTTTTGALPDSRSGGGSQMDTMIPQADQAERSTLGAVLLDREAIVLIAAWLTPEHFATQRHAHIYAAQLACYTRREPPDLTNVADELRRQDRLEGIGGVPFLIDLSNATPTAYHVEYYARLVKRAATFRQAITVGGKIAALGYDETQDEATLVATVLQLAMTLGAQRSDQAARTLSQVIDENYDRLGAVLEGTLQPGLRTDLLDVDQVLGGLFPSDLLILAARPGVGKTALMLSIARRLVARGVPVGVFELEMSRDQLLHRLLAESVQIDAGRFRRGGSFQQAEITRVMDTLGTLSTQPLIVDDTGGLTIADLRTRALRMQAEHDIQVLMVDYLGKVRDPSYRGDRVQEVSSVARGLKNLAKELHIPVVALAQLNRAVEGRADHRPTLADLRDSGEIEQEADQVAFLYDDARYHQDSAKTGTIDLILEKNRHGPLATITLTFNKQTLSFNNYAPYRAEGY